MGEKRIKPKEYSHIDYEALLIYAMKNHVSIEKAIEDNGLTIARSTVTRAIKRIKEQEEKDTSIIDFYQQIYVPNFQKPELPEKIKQVIDELPSKDVVTKSELEDLYHKLYRMNEVVESCQGNIAEATRKINSGQTPLGNVAPISVQGVRKDINYFKKVRELMEKSIQEQKEGEEK